MSFAVADHINSKRVRVIKLNESDLDRLIFAYTVGGITFPVYGALD